MYSSKDLRKLRNYNVDDYLKLCEILRNFSEASFDAVVHDMPIDDSIMTTAERIMRFYESRAKV